MKAVKTLRDAEEGLVPDGPAPGPPLSDYEDDLELVPEVDIGGNSNGTAPTIAEQAEVPSKFQNYWAGNTAISLTASYLVKGLLHPGAMSVVYGGSSTGKTFWAAYLALCVAAGREWRGRRVRQGTVVYIASEGGGQFNNRIATLRDDMQLGDDVPFLVVPEVVNLLDPAADVGDLINLGRAAGEERGEVVLIVVDTLSRAIAGGNENGAEDMTAFVRNIDKLRQDTGAHVLIVHHTGKDNAKGARGHSSLRGATDTEIEIADGCATVTKQRDLPDGDRFPFELRSICLGEDDEGDPVYSCAVEHTDLQRSARRKLSGKAQLGLEALHDVFNDDLGFKSPGGSHYPPNVTVVKVETWKEFLVRRGVTIGKNPREEFKRIKDALLEAQRIAIWDDLVWPVPA